MGFPKAVVDPQTVAGGLHGLQIAVPRYSPDGKKIAFIGGLMSDQGSTGGDVWVVDAKGGGPVNITPGIDGTPCFEAWINDKEIGFIEDRRGHTRSVDWDPIGKKEILSTDLGEVTISGGAIKDAVSVSKAGIAFVKSGLKEAPEVWIEDGDKLTQFTHLNDGAPKSTVKIESVEWENEGFHVQGWVTYPKNYDPAKKYPLIVTVHGGPSSSAFPPGREPVAGGGVL